MSTLKNLTICALMIILIISLPGNAIALASPELLELQFLATLSKTEVKPNEKFDLIISIKNGFLAVDSEFTLFLTEGLTLAANSAPHNLYQPVLKQPFSYTSLSDQQIIIPLLAFQTATDLEGIFIMNQEMVVARLDVPVTGVDPQFRRPLAPTGNYEMPIPPNISCPSEPPLSSIGLAVSDAYNAYYLSDEYTAGSFFTTHTWCNRLAGDWILDVPNVTETTTPINAEEFYEKTSDLLANTQYTFSISTLQFNTHEASIEEHRLVRQYLAPAVRTLHDNTPTNGTFPLIRIIYSAPPLGFSSDSKQDILADLTAQLPDPTIEPWRVSIAVAQVGVMLAVPWNHSKIAVSDYRFAIVGGMNWVLDYVTPMDDQPNPDNRIPHRLYDLSMNIEGEAAKVASVYFDKLWRRTIDPLGGHLSINCISSWDTNPPPGEEWGNDCQLEQVPSYAPNHNEIPGYAITSINNVFGLGRGHANWYGVGELDLSADKAILAAINTAQESILLSQHQLTSQLGTTVPEIIDALVNATLRGVQVRIALSEVWGGNIVPYTPHEIFVQLQNEIYTAGLNHYGIENLQEIYNAQCKLSLGPFHVANHPFPETLDHIYYNHSKLFIVDQKAFYIGSQNLYPSGVDAGGLISELNEYGFLVDDAELTTQVVQEYWDPVWEQTGELAFDVSLPPGWTCVDGLALLNLDYDQFSHSQTSHFGEAVDISGNYAIVGAPFADNLDLPGEDHGAVYFYEYDGDTWHEKEKIFASDSDAGGHFGKSVAISGDWAIVGHGQAVHIFERIGGQWTEQQILLPDFQYYGGGFGKSLDIANNYIIVGDPYDTAGPGCRLSANGRVYLFVHEGGQWTEVRNFHGYDCLVGQSVALNNHHAFFSSYNEIEGFGEVSAYSLGSGSFSTPYSERFADVGTVRASSDHLLVSSLDAYRQSRSYLLHAEDQTWNLQQEFLYSGRVAISEDYIFRDTGYDKPKILLIRKDEAWNYNSVLISHLLGETETIGPLQDVAIDGQQLLIGTSGKIYFLDLDTPQLLRADFSAQPREGVQPLAISFTDRSVGTSTTWQWDFGDGTPLSNEQNPVHEYTQPGSYTVSLAVSNANGSDTETKTNYITVSEPSTATPTAAHPLVTQPEPPNNTFGSFDSINCYALACPSLKDG